MKQLPKALDHNGDLWVASSTIGDVFYPRVAGRFAFAPGFLAIGAALAVLLIASLSPVDVQLAIATVGALLGIWTVRQRSGPVPASDGPVTATAHKKVFPSDTQRLALLGDAMLLKAHRDRQPLSIAVFHFSDLPELQAVFKGQTADSFGTLIARRLQLIAPAKGVVVRTGPTTFAVLVPNFDGGRTRLAIKATLGHGCCIEFDLGNGEILLVPEFAAQTVRGDATSIEQVYQQLRVELDRGQLQAERRHAYLKLERESHTRPMPLMPSVQLPMAATMPAAIGL